jgi:hypothetical protein
MAKPKLQGLKRLADMKASLPPATQKPPKSKGEGVGLMITVPAETLRALRTRAAETDSTVRAVVLEALNAKGYPVPAAELVDRRRRT